MYFDVLEQFNSTFFKDFFLFSADDDIYFPSLFATEKYTISGNEMYGDHIPTVILLKTDLAKTVLDMSV